jgi:hypothetical protein
MVNGNPYISANKATTKALNALNERQSLLVFGLVKLKAKIKKIAELIIAINHRPYDGELIGFIGYLLT